MWAGGEKKSKMLEIAHVWVQAWENLFQRVASCEEERLCVLASLCPSTTLHLFLYWYKRNTAEYTKTHIALWRGNTIHETTSQTQTESTTSWLCGHRVYRKDDPRDSQTHMNSWCLLILIMNIPKKALPLICGRFFSLFFFGTSEDPLLSFTVSSKSTHSLPIGPDLHMKWYPSFSSTLAPLSTHMPGSEEAGKAHNWSVSLGWKSVTKVSPPRSTQEWLQIQIYCKLKWKFCRANTKHFFFFAWSR